MARIARQTEKDATYHILITGCSENQLFRDKEDYKYFLVLVGDLVKAGYLKLYCYCMMPDHAHLVCIPQDRELAYFMKLLTGRYASYYNKRYKRVGPVFAGRYKSEIISDDIYLKKLIRFIIQDPVRMKLSVLATDYPYSSAMSYILPEGPLVDINRVLKLFSDNHSVAKANYIKYAANRAAEWFMDVNASSKLKIQHRLDVERRCWRALSDELGLLPAELQQQDMVVRKEAITVLRRQGATIKQIMTLTGCSYYTVQKIATQFHKDFTAKV